MQHRWNPISPSVEPVGKPPRESDDGNANRRFARGAALVRGRLARPGACLACVDSLFTHQVFHDEGALRYSLASVAAIIGPVAALLTWYGMKPYAACVARSRTWT